MTVELVFVDALTCEFRSAGRLLARYRADPGAPLNESPKPCLHPVFTLGGELVTDFRPADHTWHHGIAWAFTYINGDTFWGGPTFQDPEKGYGWLENHGSQRHLSWHVEPAASSGSSPSATLLETVHWLSAQANLLLVETRRITAVVNDAQTWQLHFASEFTNVSDSTLSFRSPVGNGRPEGGYFGLMWRGPATWANGRIHSATGAANMMGQTAPWLAYERAAIEAKTPSLLFIDHPQNPRFPTAWFVRNQDQPLATFALAYTEPLELAPSEELRLRYTLAIADSALTPAQAEEMAQRVQAGQ